MTDTKALTTNETDWDYDMLQQGVASLTEEAAAIRAHGDRSTDASHKKAAYALSLALQHAADFIEWNIKEGEILSPLETYFTQK